MKEINATELQNSIRATGFKKDLSVWS